MKLETLRDMPPWDWPTDADQMLQAILRDRQAQESERILAAELAGELTVIGDELVDSLLAIAESDEESEGLRARAVISLGPASEHVDIFGFEDDSVPISEAAFHEMQHSLYNLYSDPAVIEEVRRRALEASVPAPQDWHREAIGQAYASGDESWRLTAVFCMRFVRGFDEQILEALNSENPDIHYEAVCAAGSSELDAAWPHIASLATLRQADKALLLAAIDAVASIRPQQAGEVLVDLTDSDDEDVVEAAYEAMAMTDLSLDDFDDEEEDEYDEGDDGRRLH